MAKQKGSRIIIHLECTECRTTLEPKHKEGVSRYTTTKNRRNTSARLERKKFCPYCNTHTIHKETK